MTTSELSSILNKTAPSIKFECEEWNRTDNSCSFKVAFPIENVDKVYDPNIWPCGAAVRRFKFPKQKNFQENTPLEPVT